MMWLAALILALTATAAHASQAGQAAMQNWTNMDKCGRKAQTDHPDYSAESYAKRDAQMKECLERRSLPSRAPLAPGH
jgi:hypothetical protein